MKNWKKLLTVPLALALILQLAPAGLAACSHSDVISATPRQTVCSPWAKEEIAQAGALGLVSGYVDTNDATTPIDRKDYCRMAMQYLTAEQKQEYFWDMVAQNLATHDRSGMVPNAFTDCDDCYDPASIRVTLAHTIGLVEGVGNGKYNPDRSISRQEAAVMLARAYTVIGGELPKGSLSYADRDDIADWAKDSVAAVTQLGVMQGVGDNLFDPDGTYTTEQCIATFLRLYEKAPVSRPNGNVKQFFGRDAVMKCLADLSADESSGFSLCQSTEGPLATFVQTAVIGVMGGYSSLLLVYPDGTTQPVEPDVCSTTRAVGKLSDATVVKNVQFSADGKILTFTVPLEQDTVVSVSGTPVVLHQKGDYFCTVDVSTGICTTKAPQ